METLLSLSNFIFVKI